MTTLLTRLPPVAPVFADLPSPKGSAAERLRQWAAGHRLGLVGYLVPVLVTTVVVVAWFRPGHFIASGDVAPFVRGNLAQEWWSLWSHQSSGAGSTSYEAGRATEVWLLAVAHALHLSEVAAQVALFVICCGLAVFGSAYFAATWTRRPGVVAAAGLAGAFNVYQLVNLPNLLPVVAIGVGGLVGGLLLRAAQRRAARPLVLVAVSLPLAYLSLNPPLLAAVLVWGAGIVGAARLLCGPGGCARAARLALRALPLAIAVNAWWLVPFVLALARPAGLEFTAETDVAAWAWSHARNSIPNVLTLNAHWGWSHPEYFPYAASLDAAPWAWARWLLPALAIVGVVLPLRQYRRPALVLGATLLVLVLVGKGLHAPGADVNAWVYQHVPGAWLFREPMSKVGPFLVLIEAALAALAVERVFRHPRLTGVLRRALAGTFVLALFGALAYPWPFWTGAVITEDRPPMPGARVAVPQDWRTTADAVNRAGGTGSTLILPLNPYYQVTTNWGYHGVDAVPKQLLDRPVLQSLPGGYFAPYPVVESLTADVAQALLDGDAAGARRQLEALGVSTVVVRRDLVRGPTDLPFADPVALAEGMTAVPDAAVISDTPVATAWRLGGRAERVRAYSDVVMTPPGTADEVAAAVAVLPRDVVSVAQPVVADGLAWQATGSEDHASFSLAGPGTYDVAHTSRAGGFFRATVQELPGGGHRIVLTPTTTLRIDGRAVAGRAPVELAPVSARPVALAVDGKVQFLGQDTLVHLAGRSRLTVLTDGGGPTVLGDPAGTGDCHNVADVPARGLSATVEAGPQVRLTSETHAACAWWDVGTVPGGGPLVVQVWSRSERGAPARTCLWRPAEQRCVGPSTTSEQPDGRRLTFVDLAPDTAADQLYVYADGVAGGTTTVYGAPVVRRLQVASETDVELPPAPPVRLDLAAGGHVVHFSDDVPQVTLRPLSAVEDCDVAGGGDDKGLAVQHLPGGAQLRATDGVACAWTEPADPLVANRYQVSLTYRALAGQPARLCVWQTGPNRCADIPVLPPGGAAWRTFTTDVVPEPGTQSLRLYVYADGQASLPTVTEYRDLALRPSTSAVVTVTRASVAPSPEVWSECRAERCDVRVRGVEGDFVLEVAESWAPGWQLSGLPAGWTAERVPTSGYANGWRITGHGDASLVVVYDPQRIASAAQATSAVAGLGILAFVGYRMVVEVRRTRRRWGPQLHADPALPAPRSAR